MTNDVPDNVRNAALWRRLRKKIWKENPQNSAYRSGLLVQRYKDAGGKFAGRKPQSGLSRWFREEWIDVGHYLRTGKRRPCGAEDRREKYCRPWTRVDAETPVTVREADREALRENVRRKRQGERPKPLAKV